MAEIKAPFQSFVDTDGTPLQSGFVYVGVSGSNPETNPTAIYWDSALTQPAAQPLRTVNGYIARSGTPARIFSASSDISMTVRSRTGSIVFSALTIGTEQAAIDLLSQSSGSSLVGYIQSGAGAVARTVQARLRDTLSVKDFGALGDDSTDDYAAFTAAIAALQEFQTLLIPNGNYRLSSTWIIENKYRTKIVCEGVLKPHGGYSDYLVKFTNSSGDPIIPSMAQQITATGLTLDCEWTSRGVMIEKAYDSSFIDIAVWRPYGHGIYSPMLQEVAFWKPVIFAGKPRVDATIAAAADWDAVTTYTTGDLVKREYPAYNVLTTYAGNDVVSYSDGYLYMSTIDSNLGNLPDNTNAAWQRIPHEYFEATSLAGNLNKDPHDAATDYSTRSGTAGDRFWKPVYPDEAAWEITGVGDTNTIDNVKVFNFISRSNAQNDVIRIDNTENNLPPLKFDFYAPQLHVITEPYAVAFNADATKVAEYGGNVLIPELCTMVRAASGSNIKFNGGQIQLGTTFHARAMSYGTLGKSGVLARSFLSSFYIEGTASGEHQTGICIMPSVETFGTNWFETDLSIILSGSNNNDKVDPTGETILYQTGTATIPAGDSSVAVTFSPPLAATPNLSIRETSQMRGLNYSVSGLTKDGFTITLTGRYMNATRTAVFTAAGGVNQSDTYTHNTGIQSTGIVAGEMTADGGATFRLREGSTTANATILAAPAAPAADLNVPWSAFWESKSPFNLSFSYTARVTK